MSAEVTRQLDALVRAATHVAAANGDLQMRCDDVRTILEQRLKPHWQGAGALACGEVLSQWEVHTRKTLDTLDRFEQQLRDSERAYARADEAAGSVMNRLAGKLG